MRRLLGSAIVAAGIAAAVLAGGTAATASTGVEVDFGDCAFNNNGVATALAGSPITVTDTGAGAAGNYGTALHAYESSVTTATIAVTGGATTTIPLVGSFPQFVGDPYFAWLTFLPDIPLDPLAAAAACSSPSTASTRPAEKSSSPSRRAPLRTSAPSTTARETPSKPNA